MLGKVSATMVAAALLLADGVAAVAADAPQGPVRSMTELRSQGVVIQKFDLSCAAAALATLLNSQHGDPVSEREIARSLIGRDVYLADPSRVQRAGGFSLLDLKRFADGRGYKGTGYGRLTLPRLVDLAPVIVPVNFNGYAHFVIFRGVVGDHVLLADPAYGNRIVSVGRFERAWIEYPPVGRVGFIVARNDGTPAPPGGLAPNTVSLTIVPDAVLRTTLPFASQPPTRP
jgi:predicted double-glycine peptidase